MTWLYDLLMADAILAGLTILVYLVGGIKLYGPITLWLRKELSDVPDFDKGVRVGAKIENTRIRKILKNEYLIAKQQDDLKTVEIAIKINKQIKQEEAIN